MTALVTGAAGLMGSAVAEALAGDGHHLGLVDISSRRLEPVEQTLAPRTKVVSVRADVTEPDEASTTVDTIVEQIGEIDVLVNVVGGYRGEMYQNVLDIPLERFDDAMRRNLRGTFLLTQLVGRRMVRNGAGCIVNISSVASAGATGQADYSAAKAGVEAFTRSCALELGPTVRVNAVSPGLIETSVMERLPDHMHRAYLERTPLKRPGSADDVGAAVRFLASDDARFVTGEVLHISGGFLGCL